MGKEEKIILKVIGILLILGILIGCGFLIKNLIDKDNKPAPAKKDKGVCCPTAIGVKNCTAKTSSICKSTDACKWNGNVDVCPSKIKGGLL
tara:strand:+ start:840 stop:1112 length:273 start_codon:yes stop_codon:yes gene_type:complete